MTMIIDGKAIAEELFVMLSERSKKMQKPPVLGILVAGADPVTEQFVRAKSRAAARLGVEIVRESIPETANAARAIEAIHVLAPKCDGIVVQLPLPASCDVNAVLSEVPPHLDVEATNPRHSGERLVPPPVALAIEEVLHRSRVSVHGKKAIVIGAGRLVGAPAVKLLQQLGADVSVHTTSDSLSDLIDADIIVCGAGSPGLVKPAAIKEGVVLIDAGTSEAAGKVVGDCDPSCAEKAGVFTPVPGGLGPIVVAMLLKNLFDIAEHTAHS